MYLTIKDLQVYLGGVSERTAIRFKKSVLTETGKKHATNKRKKINITIYDVAKYHNVPLNDVLITIKPH